jgi:hypothetical protein
MRQPEESEGLAPPEARVASGGARRHSQKQLALAVTVAAVSDALAFFVVLLPPAQWALDIVTAFLLFLILGKRWAILPGLVSEAIPGWGIFPAWILVVGSIYLYDDIKKIRIKL